MRLTFLRAVTALASAVVVLTELLGALELIRRGPLVAVWLGVAVCAVFAL